MAVIVGLILMLAAVALIAASFIWNGGREATRAEVRQIKQRASEQAQALARRAGRLRAFTRERQALDRRAEMWGEIARGRTDYESSTRTFFTAHFEYRMLEESEEHGTLFLRRQWVMDHRLHSDGRWESRNTLLYVKCPSTGEEHLLCCPPEFESAKDARAWTFGMSAEEFAPEAET